MHFNEMSVKSRQLGLAFVAAALGIAVVMMSRGQDFSVTLDFPIALPFLAEPWRPVIHVSVLIVLAALLALNAVKKLDLNVYHKILRGAVAFGEELEEQYLKKITPVELGMTQAISFFSRNEGAKFSDVASPRYSKETGAVKTAGNKLAKFYFRTSFFLFLTAIFVFVVTNMTTSTPGPTLDAAATSSTG